jgi:5-methylthioadenosine/S-adenosylhomocysteine deaminase
VSAGDIAVIAAHGCAIAHCPASNAKLGHGIAPLTDLLEAGVVVGLGTDSVASSNRMDLLDEARLAILVQRVRCRTPDVLAPARMLELATLGSARALGLDHEIGSLDVGKAADLAVFDLHPVSDTPSYDPASALIFAAPGRRARFVTVAGRVLVRDGALLEDVGSDLAAVRRAAEALARFTSGSQ